MAGEANESSKNSPAMISPGFRSAAALAGWDEEALLLATLVVEDTPVRESRHKKHPAPQSKTPNSATSNRKRRSRLRGRSAASIPAVVLRLDDQERVVEQDSGVKRGGREEEKEKSEKEGILEGPSSSNVIPGMDRLREELSCAICLEICFEPSTTTCGHSFCKKCLENAASRCGRRCPKCRQLISGRSCSVNTVLWNTIQLLFPDEVELRKKTTDTTSPTNTLRIKSRPERANGNTITSSNTRTSTRVRSVIRRESSTRRREAPSQSEDAAMARRLQREEFMEAFRDPAEQSRHVSVYTASNNLRAMASRAVHFRRRGRFPYIID